MQKLAIIFAFYRPYLFYAVVLSMVLLPICQNIIPAVLFTKLFLMLFLWYNIKDTKLKKDLLAFRNRGFSNIQVFLIVSSMDLLITLPFLLILSEFI